MATGSSIAIFDATGLAAPAALHDQRERVGAGDDLDRLDFRSGTRTADRLDLGADANAGDRGRLALGRLTTGSRAGSQPPARAGRRRASGRLRPAPCRCGSAAGGMLGPAGRPAGRVRVRTFCIRRSPCSAHRDSGFRRAAVGAVPECQACDDGGEPSPLKSTLHLTGMNLAIGSRSSSGAGRPPISRSRAAQVPGRRGRGCRGRARRSRRARLKGGLVSAPARRGAAPSSTGSRGPRSRTHSASARCPCRPSGSRDRRRRA